MVFSAILISLLVLLFITEQCGNRTYRTAAIVAFLGHVFVALVVLPLLPYGWDITQFHNAAVTITSGGYPDASSTVTAFGTVQGILYAILGIDTRVVSIVNGFLAVLVPIPALYIVRQLYGTAVRYVNGVAVAILFMPLSYLFLTIPMRGALTIFLVFTVLALVVHSINRENVVTGLVAAPLFGLVYLLRSEWGLVLLLGALAGIGTKLFRKLDLDLSLSSLTALLGIVGAVGVVLFAEVMYSLDRANAELAYRASGGAVYLEGMQYHSWFDLLLAAPGRAIYFQFAPFPLHVESVFHALAFVSTVYVIVFVVAAARSLYACKTDQVVLVTLLVVYLAGITGYGLINSNFGTNVRHRIPFVFLLIVFASPVIQRWELRFRQWLGVWPDQRDQHDSQHHEAQELDGHV